MSTPHVRLSTSEAAATLAHAEVRTATQTSMLTQHKPPHLYILHTLVPDTAEIIKAEQTACNNNKHLIYLYQDTYPCMNHPTPP